MWLIPYWKKLDYSLLSVISALVEYLGARLGVEWNPLCDLPAANIKLEWKWLTIKSTLANGNKELIAAVKSFKVLGLGDLNSS